MQRLLDDLLSADLTRRRLTWVLTLAWRDGDMLVHGERPQLERLHERLRALA
jgi:hypothetical protein